MSGAGPNGPTPRSWLLGSGRRARRKTQSVSFGDPRNRESWSWHYLREDATAKYLTCSMATLETSRSPLPPPLPRSSTLAASRRTSPSRRRYVLAADELLPATPQPPRRRSRPRAALPRPQVHPLPCRPNLRAASTPVSILLICKQMQI